MRVVHYGQASTSTLSIVHLIAHTRISRAHSHGSLWTVSGSYVTREAVFHRDAWLMVKARWENKFDVRVKAIQTDNGGEYMGNVFTSSLRDAWRDVP